MKGSVSVCFHVQDAKKLCNKNSWKTQSFTTRGFICQRCIKNSLYDMKNLYIEVNLVIVFNDRGLPQTRNSNKFK